MKRLALIFFTCIFLCACKTIIYKEQANNYFPKNTKQEIVQDLSYVFIPSEVEIFSNKIIAFEKLTSNEIAILTVDSILPYHDIQKYGTDVANYWGIGKKEKNNGLLIVLCNPCKKVSICTGLGIQKIITDSICQELIDYTMIPEFKKTQYFEGIANALDSIISKWQ